jgi:hypothetical protein
MSEQDWGKEAILDSPHVRQQLEQQLQILHPPADQAARVTSPPVPAPAQEELRAVLDNPRLAEALWQHVSVPLPLPTAQPADQPPDDAVTMVQLGLALYYLHALHFQDQPGHEHLPRNEGRARSDDDEGEDPFALPER